MLDLNKKTLKNKTIKYKSLIEEDMYYYLKNIIQLKDISVEDKIEYITDDVIDTVKYVIDKTSLNYKEKQNLINKLKNKL